MVECTQLTDLFVHDPLSSSGYPTIIYTHPIADNLPIKKTLVARRLQTNIIMWMWPYVCECVFVYVLSIDVVYNTKHSVEVVILRYI